jgi:hypothetical protein
LPSLSATHFKVGRALPLPRRPIFPSRAHNAGRKTSALNSTASPLIFRN